MPEAEPTSEAPEPAETLSTPGGEDSAGATEPAKDENRLALNTAVKKAFAAVGAVSGVLAAISVFTAQFAKTGSALVAMTLAAFAALMLVGVGISVLATYLHKEITATVGRWVGALVIAVAVGAGGGNLVWHARSTPATTSGDATATENAASGFTAEVAWTNDDGGGGSTSTTLYTFSSPTSHIHTGEYPLGASLTVVCQVPNGRAIMVGPQYAGPDPTSTVWYQLDQGSWVPAVYVHVDDLGAVPACP